MEQLLCGYMEHSHIVRYATKHVTHNTSGADKPLVPAAATCLVCDLAPWGVPATAAAAMTTDSMASSHQSANFGMTADACWTSTNKGLTNPNGLYPKRWIKGVGVGVDACL